MTELVAHDRATSLVLLHQGGSVADEMMQALIAERDLRHSVRVRVPSKVTSAEAIAALDVSLIASEDYIGPRTELLLEHAPDVVSMVCLLDGAARIRSMAPTPEAARDAAAQLREILLAEETEDEAKVRITFWSKAMDEAPRQVTREVAAEPWSQLADNYGAAALGGMQELLRLQACPEARLILWHGPPGTGKTHALRALGLDWASWCATHFVCDPERLLNDVAGYLVELMNETDARREGQPDRAKLLILEDSGELMSASARADAGQGLSRLLNLTDGILGQGLDLMVLITTNEPIGSLHEAVTRPGRCLSEIEFGALSPAEANAWLTAHDCDTRVSTEATLADLYAILRGELPRAVRRRPVGFAA